MPARPNPAAAAAGAITASILAGPILSLFGFGAAGIAAGSIAAGIQSGIGNVAARSLFAILQSAGAGGYGFAIVHGVIQVAGAAAGAAASFWSGRSDGEDDEGNGDDDSNDEEGSGDDNSTNGDAPMLLN